MAIQRLLIANRGEIACRIATTAKRLGIHTIAVFSEADANGLITQLADEAYCIGSASPQESYLNLERILSVAKQSGADAIHPGYGFLSENATFAQRCQEENIIFVGPNVHAIQAMGSKSAAKALMATAGVPLVPGYHGEAQDLTTLQQQADQIGYPLLIKASAGGGGKGMRIVQNSAEFASALASCQREALASFSDDRVLLERYLTTPRHVEVQIFADHYGETVYLSERDCSIQRRHQKVLEEAPAPNLSDEQRQALGVAAVAAARAVNYVGAGTIEFIMDASGEFYFMEMNTRLQVEHPITEMITGLDLVEWQLRIAQGEALALRQEQITLSGHAIEARLYAENPEQDFLPAIGTIKHLNVPPHVKFKVGESPTQRANVRIDGAINSGTSISPYYDPMIAKLISWGRTREEARLHLLTALASVELSGIQTNLDFLKNVLRHSAFIHADLSTDFIPKYRTELLNNQQPIPVASLALACVAELINLQKPSTDPWDDLDFWNAHNTRKLSITWQVNHNENDWYETQFNHQELTINDKTYALSYRQENDRLLIQLDDYACHGKVMRSDTGCTVFLQGCAYSLEKINHQFDNTQAQSGHGQLRSPMPGKIIDIRVNVGDPVKAGDPLLVMEAMKMEHTLLAPHAGTIAELFFQNGDQVTADVELLSITPDEH